MEHLGTQTAPDQGLKVGKADEAAVAPAALKEVSGGPNLEKVGNGKPNAIDAQALAGDDIVDLVQKIENLKKNDAIARLLELEEHHEKTFFEIGGVLSAIQKNKWFEPFASLDEWLEKNTAVKRGTARALIQTYDAIVKSGVKWDKVKQIGWTKLRAIAGVLDAGNADHLIEVASNHTKAEIIRLVQDHLAGSAGQKPSSSTATQVKTFKFRDDQIKTVQAAIDRAKEVAGAEHDTAALEIICRHYILAGQRHGTDRQGTCEIPLASTGATSRNARHYLEVGDEWTLASAVAKHIRHLDENAVQRFHRLVNAFKN